MHEVCHHEASNGSHTHDEHFYREFHDLLQECLPGFVKDCVRCIPSAMETYGRRETKKMLAEKDKLERSSSRVAAAVTLP